MARVSIEIRKATRHEIAELLHMRKNGTAFEIKRCMFLLALIENPDDNHTGIHKLFGINAGTSRSLVKAFNAKGPDACRYQFNELASICRMKIGFDAQNRAIELVKSTPLTLVQIIERLRAEGFIAKDVSVSPDTVSAMLKRAGMSSQRTRYSLKKSATKQLSPEQGPK
jgi:transposase